MAEERTLGQLVSEASADLSELVRYEIALAKAEITDDLKRGAVGGGLFAVAGYFLFLMTITAVITIGYALVAAGLSAWLAFLIVTVGLLVIAGLLGLVGFLLVRRIKPPERAIRSTKQTLAAVRGNRSNGAARP
jgi:putative superfamily III holin-X